MTITPNVRNVTNTNLTTAQTSTLGGARTYTLGNQIVIFGVATRNEAGTGLGASFAILDNGNDETGNDLTWTEVDATTIFDPGGGFGTQTKAWLSSPITDDTESLTITIDGRTSSTQQFFYGGHVVELHSDVGEISVVQSDDGGGQASSPNVVFGSTPAGYQLLFWSLIQDATATMPAAPTNFTKVTGGVSTASGTSTQLLESSTNTATSIAYNPTTSGGAFGRACIGIEFAEAGGDPSEGSAAVDADAALTAAGAADHAGAADLAADAAIAATGARDSTGAGGLAADAALAGASARDSAGTAALAATAAVAATGARDSAGSSSLAAGAALVAVGARDSTGVSDLAASATLAAAGSAPTLVPEGVATLDGTAVLAAVGATAASGTATLAASAALAGTGARSVAGTADLAATAVLAAGAGTPGPAGLQSNATPAAALAASAFAAAAFAASAEPAADLRSTASEEVTFG